MVGQGKTGVDVLLDRLSKLLDWIEPLCDYIESKQRFFYWVVFYLVQVAALMLGFLLGIKYALTYMV